VEALAKARHALESVMVHADERVVHQIEVLQPVVDLLGGIADLYGGNGHHSVAVEPESVGAQVPAAAAVCEPQPPAPEPLSPEPEGASPKAEGEGGGGEPVPFAELTVGDLNVGMFGKEELEDEAWLKYMHHTLNLSASDIAKLTGVSIDTSKRYILKAGVGYRSSRGSRSKLRAR